MAKYTVAVCDDEKEDLSFLVRKITEYDTHQLFEIKTYTDGELLFDELKSQKTSIDLLLLDIEMPSNGFQLARTLQALPKHPMVIFVTRQHEYAVQGYGIAFRYGVCGEIINFVRIQRTSCMLWRRMPFLLSRKTTEQRL